jgi:hypothetical protein
MTVYRNQGPVTLEHLVVKENAAPGIEIENSAGPVTIRTVSLVRNKPGIRVQNVATQSSPVRIERCVFERNREGGLTVDVVGDATLAVDVENNSFRDNHGGAIILRSVSQTGGSQVANMAMLTANIRNNDLINTASIELPKGNAIDLTTGRGARIIGKIASNTIRNHSGDGISIAGDGDLDIDIGGKDTKLGNVVNATKLGDAIELDMDEKGGRYSWNVRIQHNTIGGGDDDAGGVFSGIADDGIQVRHRDGDGTLNLLIDNNHIANVGSEGIRFFSDEDLSSGGDRPSSRIAITNNRMGTVRAAESVFIRTRDSADTCVHMHNNSITAPGNVLLDQGGSSILAVTHSSLAELMTDNGGVSARGDGALITGQPCAIYIP